MDRRYDKLLRSYGDPEKLFQRLVDDKDLLGFVLAIEFLKYNGVERCSCDVRSSSEFSVLFLGHAEDCDYTTYLKQHLKLLDDFTTRFVAELCDCGIWVSILGRRRTKTALSPSEVQISWEYPVLFSGHHGFSRDCNLTRAWRDMRKTWGPYILRKEKEFLHEAQLNR